jgi:DNA-binding NarL/FixJ family response regulator
MYRTLIVEDNETFRLTLQEILHELYPTMTLEGAVDGVEALQKIEEDPPDLIFMDINLPGENGLTLTKTIMASHPESVIIIITNYDLPEYREAAQKYGAKYFLSKSNTSMIEISALVESLLAGRDMDL